MDSKRLKAEHVLDGLGLFGPARAIYGLTPSGRRAREDRSRKRDFYSQFIAAGDLVFDIGANLGSYADIFASLGARVVALEPNPDCVYHIRRSYPGPSIDVVNAAVGRHPELATIRLAKRSDMSSMSADWIQAIRKAQDLDDAVWDRELTVPVVTLDSLVARYGAPKFIKIDVEGLEEDVLQGLSVQPPLLSFEFNTKFLGSALRCVQLLPGAAHSEFNFAVGEPHRLELTSWVDASQLSSALKQLESASGYGDVLVRMDANTLESDAVYGATATEVQAPNGSQSIR
jgi:FkbM family methyltransferase